MDQWTVRAQAHAMQQAYSELDDFFTTSATAAPVSDQKAKLAEAKAAQKAALPIRGQSTEEGSLPAGRIASGDYRRWDQFDVEKACEEVEDKGRTLRIDPDLKAATPLPAKPSTPPPAAATPAKGDQEQAEDEKTLVLSDFGNAWFKRGEYASAIYHYNAAIELQPSEAVYYLNRAMANLKLNAYDAVETDCTRAISLDAKAIKAWWRRGVARAALRRVDEAREDLQQALKLDPTNVAVKSELARLPVPPPPKQRITKRTIPIEEVGSEEEYLKWQQKMKENVAMAQRLSHPKPRAEPTPTKVSEARPESVASAPSKAVQSSADTMPAIDALASEPAPPVTSQTPAVPIAAASSPLSKESTFNADASAMAPTPVPAPSTQDVPIPAVPATAFQFDRLYRSLEPHPDALHAFLLQLTEKDVLHLFLQGIETEYLDMYMICLPQVQGLDQVHRVLRVLNGFAKCARFSMARRMVRKELKQKAFAHLSAVVPKEELTFYTGVCSTWQV